MDCYQYSTIKNSTHLIFVHVLTSSQNHLHYIKLFPFHVPAMAIARSISCLIWLMRIHITCIRKTHSSLNNTPQWKFTPSHRNSTSTKWRQEGLECLFHSNERCGLSEGWKSINVFCISSLNTRENGLIYTTMLIYFKEPEFNAFHTMIWL